MIIINDKNELKKITENFVKEGKSIGFVPTMGYLHKGHESLIKEARKNNDIVIVSVFVNPTQFSPNEDLDKYPRDEKRDKELCEQNQVDILFMPTSENMYENDRKTKVSVIDLDKKLCGKTRPIHFDGVCLVVLKLLNLTKATRAYFGQKDAQQFCILDKMVKDLDVNCKLVKMPIIREEDGLALSSRNVYLSEDERKEALSLSHSLKLAQNSIKSGICKVSEIKSLIEENISKASFVKIDYVEIVDYKNLENIDENYDLASYKIKEVLIAIAVFVGKTRLIDNIIIKKD